MPLRIFLVGAPRSGTTLLQSLLSAHPEITSFTESHFFSRHFRRARPTRRVILVRSPTPRLRAFLAENNVEPHRFQADLAALDRPTVLRPFATRLAATTFIRILDEIAVERGFPIWLEKTPMHLHYLDFIERMVLPAEKVKFVHIVREGPEVVASLRRASQKWRKHYSVEACVERWNHDVGITLARASTAGDPVVFYEELATDPPRALQRLFADLEVPWDPGVVAGYTEAAAELIAPGESWKANTERPIEPSRSFQRSFDAAERESVLRALDSSLYTRLRNTLRKNGREESSAKTRPDAT